MTPAWVWAIISIVMCTILFTLLFTLYKKKSKQRNAIEKPEISFPSPTPTIEVIIQPQDSTLYGQQFVSVEPSQTVLSPPPQRDRKISITTTIATTVEEPIEKSRKVFSLSPHQEIDSIQDSSICSSTITTTRTITPFQGNTTWRGPTPPWTQT